MPGTLLTARPRDTAYRTLHCQGCGRRLFRYRALGGAAEIVCRCRDCKTPTTLRGADVGALLGALSQGEESEP
jgi:hypothetical protein